MRHLTLVLYLLMSSIAITQTVVGMQTVESRDRAVAAAERAIATAKRANDVAEDSTNLLKVVSDQRDRAIALAQTCAAQHRVTP